MKLHVVLYRCIRYFLFCSLLFAGETIAAQNKINLSQILDSIRIDTDSTFTISNKEIINDLPDSKFWNIENYRTIIEENYDSVYYQWRLPNNEFYVSNRPVTIQNCEFAGSQSAFFPRIKFRKNLTILNSFSTNPSINFVRSMFYADVEISGVKNILLYSCKFYNDIFVRLPEKAGINVIDCDFQPKFSNDDDFPDLYLSYLSISGQDVDFVQIVGSRFLQTDHPGLVDFENLSAQVFYFTDNIVEPRVFMQRTIIWGTLNIRECTFKSNVIINACKFPIDNFYFPFEQIKNQISISKEKGEAIVIDDTIVSVADIKVNKAIYIDKLTETLSRLNLSYKNSGDQSGASQTFILQKEIDLILKKSNLVNNFSFNLFFDFLTTKFLGWYSDFGTSTSKCIARTFLIVFIFSCMYAVDFFIISRKIPIGYLKKGITVSNGFTKVGNYFRRVFTYKKSKRKKPRTFIKPAQRKYIYPIISARILYTLYILFHSILLSINAFFGIGYGELSVRKELKYLYFAEGVIGWFLIIFLSVSILSQTVQ